MKKILKKQQLEEIRRYPEGVVKSIADTITILDENYGVDRDIVEDLGGYVIVVETITDLEEIKENILKGAVAEYTDIIECSEGVNYTSSLFLLSSDYAILVIATEELTKILLA